MKEKWESLNQREQRLVVVMSVFIAIFLVYLTVWAPITSSIEDKEKKVVKYQKLLTWVHEKEAELTSLSAQQRGKASNASLSTIVNRSAGKNGIVIARVQPQGNEISLAIDAVSFNTLMDWLKGMSTSDGVSIKAMDLAKTDVKGVVKVRRLNLGKS